LEVPSLTGFLIWLDTGDVEVKRQADSEGGRIRVMTVHGAKGLEAPIVILPDTADRKPQDRDEIVREAAGNALWKTASDDSPPLIAAARSLRGEKSEEENLRLLYVAMTRARCWLIVAAAGTVKQPSAWHSLVADGMVRAGATAIAGGVLRVANGDWPDPAPLSAVPAARVALPGWVHRPAPDQPRPAEPVSPSNLGGAKALPGLGLDEAAAKLHGHLLHLLLEHLPATPRADWPRIADALIADADARADLLAEAVAVLSTPDLAALFAPGTLAEVALTADLGGRPLLGTIDRLLIAPGRVLAVDFKSNREQPATAAAVPEGILRQMGAYAHALAQIYPGRRIDTAILWTRTCHLMPLDPDIVSAALQRAAIP